MLMDKHNDLAISYECQLIFNSIIGEAVHGSVQLDPEDILDDNVKAIWTHLQTKEKVNINELDKKFNANGFIDSILDTKLFVMGNLSVHELAKKITELAHRRRLHKSMIASVKMIESDLDLKDVENFTYSAFDDVPDDKEAQPLKPLLIEAYHNLEDACSGKYSNFVESGYLDFDNVFGGLQRNGLIIVAGRPSMGKTAFALRVARNVGERLPVLFFSTEMDRLQITMRLLSSEKNVDLQYMMQGKLGKDDWRGLASSAQSLHKNNVFVNDRTSRTIADIAAEIRRFKRKHNNLGLVVIDYLQLIKLPKRERFDLSVGEASRAFKVLAGELQCPVMLLSQLNRALETRENKRPLMSDLRESGSIEQDADQIIFPYRDEVYNTDPDVKGIAEIIMRKNKNGKTGSVFLSWVAKSATFKDKEHNVMEGGCYNKKP